MKDIQEFLDGKGWDYRIRCSKGNLYVDFYEKKEIQYELKTDACCGICFGDIDKDDCCDFCELCGNVAHSSCLNVWKKEHHTCIYCRQEAGIVRTRVDLVKTAVDLDTIELLPENRIKKIKKIEKTVILKKILNKPDMYSFGNKYWIHFPL